MNYPPCLNTARGEAYCDTCGNGMMVAEVNMSWYEYQCFFCGNTFTSHAGSNVHERLRNGYKLAHCSPNKDCDECFKRERQQ